ncbi:MAG: hypothetical protein N2112_11080 [Gemmataceae bacterium]|jgi:hypothetical protein|nr:hypothetical protein [Gemmataceae bacterium]
MTETPSGISLNQINSQTSLEVLQQYVQTRLQEGINGETILDELRSRGVSVSQGIAAIKKEKSPEKVARWFYPKMILSIVLMIAAGIGVVIAFANDTGEPRKMARTLFYLTIPAVAGLIMLVDLLSSKNQSAFPDSSPTRTPETK